jgi:outer membrane protein assembly factor BamB
MSRLELQEALPAVILGVATLEERLAVEAALKTDPELAREAKELEAVLTGLAGVEAVPVPAGLKAKVMAQAKLESKTSSPETMTRETRANTSSAPSSRARGVAPRSMLQRFAPALYLVGAIAIFSAMSLLPNVFKSAHDPVNASVVASTQDGGLVYANSGAVVTPVVLISSSGQRQAVKFPTGKPCYFTNAVSVDGYSYLLDAANSKLFIIDETKGAMVDQWDVPAGAAGLAVEGNTVIVKSAESGIVLEFKRNREGKTMLEARIAPETPSSSLPMDDLMDDLLILGSRVYATHHIMGTVSVLDRETNKEINRFKIGIAPVALGQYGENLIVLDHAGALIAVNANSGKQVNTLKLEGDADKMTITHGMAFLSDRSGFVTVVNLEQFKVETRKQFGNNARDVSPMPDGHVAVATGEGGVIVLNDQLEKMNTY